MIITTYKQPTSKLEQRKTSEKVVRFDKRIVIECSYGPKLQSVGTILEDTVICQNLKTLQLSPTSLDPILPIIVLDLFISRKRRSNSSRFNVVYFLICLQNGTKKFT